MMINSTKMKLVTIQRKHVWTCLKLKDFVTTKYFILRNTTENRYKKIEMIDIDNYVIKIAISERLEKV